MILIWLFAAQETFCIIINIKKVKYLINSQLTLLIFVEKNPHESNVFFTAWKLKEQIRFLLLIDFIEIYK